MKVLLTGAFGNIGTNAVAAILEKGHQLRCFDRETEVTRKRAERFEGRVEVVWGDLRDPGSVAAAVDGCEVVIHVAFALPPFSERYPDRAREINVGGMQNILHAMKSSSPPSKIILISTSSVFKLDPGNQSQRTASDPLEATEATDNYTQHKLECEKMVRESGLDWCICRSGVVPPISRRLNPGIFYVPLDTHMSFLHPRDAGLALANAVTSDEIWGKVLLLGSGPESQIHYRDFVGSLTRAMGFGKLPDEAFGTKPYYTVWMDTSESQRLLDYQRHSFAEFAREMPSLVGYRRYWVRLFRPYYRRRLLKQSPFLGART
jgi:nucleoside-diphosphate-sugar epimerase